MPAGKETRLLHLAEMEKLDKTLFRLEQGSVLLDRPCPSPFIACTSVTSKSPHKSRSPVFIFLCSTPCFNIIISKSSSNTSILQSLQV
uniref:Uncharacterized protein n=1 Tax=Catharus ustulatus TaxID=91951 RepID=A0A8C3TS62_CATUS